MRYFLVDNGSLQPESVMNLRRVARELAIKTGLPIEPASLLHSSRISPELLGGEPAVNLERRLRLALEQGEQSFTVIPFFFGPTGAIVDYLPQRIAARRQRHGAFEMERTPFLYTGDPEEDAPVLEILENRIRETITKNKLHQPRVALVDHGSPLPAVTRVRDELATGLKELLREYVGDLSPASMERRAEEKYAFNEPLLEKLLRQDGWNEGNVVISMLFLSPGRHAGPDGDVARICGRAEADSGNLKTCMTDLVGTHPDIISLLARRLELEKIPL